MKNIIKTWLKDHQIELPDERIDLLITMLKSEPKEDREANGNKIKCNHFFLPAEVIILDKYKQAHNSKDNNYRWRDVLKVERVYCAKCGKNCYDDLSDLRE